MEVYKNIDEFIQKSFPLEVDKINRRKESDIQKKIDEADENFDKKLEEILRPPTPTKN